jgi:hypothetical protein
MLTNRLMNHDLGKHEDCESVVIYVALGYYFQIEGDG